MLHSVLETDETGPPAILIESAPHIPNSLYTQFTASQLTGIAAFGSSVLFKNSFVFSIKLSQHVVSLTKASLPPTCM